MGLFNSVYSEPLSLKISDPCLGAILNPDRSLRVPLLFTVPLGETQATKQLQGTKDSVSMKYGNGYELCGPRSYQVYTETDEPFLSDALIMRSGKSGDLSGADLVSLTLLSYEIGPILSHKVKLIVRLDRYPEQKVSFPVTLEYRECHVESFMGIPVEK